MKTKAKKSSVEVVETLYFATPQAMRAQQRLNRAALAWFNENIYLHDERYVPIEHLALVRAVRAFEKAGER